MATHPTETIAPTSPSSPTKIRRVGLLLAGLILLALLASLASHLQGRSQYARAAEQFQSELSGIVPNVTAKGLRAQFMNLAPEEPPDTENAASWLMAGAQALLLEGEERTTAFQLVDTATAQWSPEQRKFVQGLVERHQGGLTTMHRAVSLKASNYGLDYSKLFDTEIPDILQLLRAAKILNLEARLAFAQDDPESGLHSLATLARLTATLRQESFLIFTLIAHATERYQLQAIAEALSSSKPWAEREEMLVRLEKLIPEDDPISASKRLVALDAAFLSTTSLEGRVWNEHKGFMGTSSRLRAYYFGHRQAAEYLHAGRQAAALAFTPSSKVSSRLKSDPPSSPLGKNLIDALLKSQLLVSQRQLVEAALALRRLGLTEGQYPSPCPPLSELTSPSPLHGQPLLCQPQSDGSLHLEIPEAANVINEFLPSSLFWILEINLPAPLDQPAASS